MRPAVRRFGRRRLPLLAAAFALVGLPTAPPLAAQAGVGAGAGAGAGAGEEQVDSARLRVLERLQRLGRPPGVDSTSYRADSLRRSRGRAAPVPVAPADSFMAALLELPGYSAARYEGVLAHFDTGTERLVLIGGEGKPARMSQATQTITAADTITMVDSLVWTAGETLTERPGEEPVRSSNIIYDLREDRGSAFDAHTKMSQGAVWIMDGDLPAILPDTVFGHEVNFTSCEEEVPHYHFAARELKAIGGSWFVARNVTLNFDDVPVMWLPFIFQSTESGRHSGILTPRFGVNDIVRTSRGHTRRVSNLGFFWAINEYSDATMAVDWWSDNFTSLTGGFRYKVNSQFLRGSANVRRFWKVDGGRELALDTRHDWQVNERTTVRVASRFASSSQFVRRNSFDPREVTQSIDSDGGVSRRFDWGTLSVSANRRQFLSDDRVEMTLPSANLSLKTITLFRAPANRARFFNNLTWSGSTRYTRSTVDRASQPDSVTFSEGLADRVSTSAGLSSSLNLGAFSWSQGMSFSETTKLDLPALVAFPGDTLGELRTGFVDKSTADLTWNMRFNYQQRLIGTTTLTPDLTISGQATRSDDIPEASSFVSGPTRISLGVRLKSDIYGFYGGFGGFEAIRHKMSPSFTWSYAPEIMPTELQETVFGSRNARAKNVISFGFNQTFEAKRSEEALAADTVSDAEAMDLEEDLLASDSIRDARADSLDARALADSLRRRPDDPDGPQRVQTNPIVSLLAIRTSVVTYDFVRADEEGNYLEGFTTTRLQNQVSSDFLRGLSISLEHDLFDKDEEGRRTFEPLLSQLNLSFAMSSNSGIVKVLGRLLRRGQEETVTPAGQAAPDTTAGGEVVPDEGEELDELDPLLNDVLGVSLTDESNVVPGAGSNDVTGQTTRQRRRRGSVGSWNANFSYSLRRNRDEDLPASQLLQVGLRLRPTEKWSMTWRTSYDMDEKSFTDHTIRLTRDLHRWEANFDFLQTATGNWTFRFQVSLIDNRDLKFDYDQRSTDVRNRF